eukprot:Blabericola_migrator_1__2363@NODE_1661_length_4065_cov_57_966733_g1079_i0_p2_GENE_NODE_1661_length_4065_cov_57_966733_g1079_i0NODE_1661_length_4065_cov_57_966733_g1079_i0_p2_ORF_typecomplete_len550_score97_53_NODE_1661_length_4065_cov_57_966733_g1079_i01391788
MPGFPFGISSPSLTSLSSFSEESLIQAPPCYRFTWSLPEILKVQVNLTTSRSDSPTIIVICDHTALETLLTSDQEADTPILIPEFFSILPPHANKLASLSKRLYLIPLPWAAETTLSFFDDSIRIKAACLPLDPAMTGAIWKLDLSRPNSNWLQANTVPLKLHFTLPSSQSIILAPNGYTDSTPINHWLQYMTPTCPALLMVPHEKTTDPLMMMKATLRHIKEAVADLIKSFVPRKSSILILSDDCLTTFFSLCEFAIGQVSRLPAQYHCKVVSFGWEIRNVLAALDSATMLSVFFEIGDIFNSKNPLPPHQHLQHMGEGSLDVLTSPLKASQCIKSEPAVIFMLGSPSTVTRAMSSALSDLVQDPEGFMQPSNEEPTMSASLIDDNDQPEKYREVLKAFLRRSCDVKIIMDLSRHGLFHSLRQDVCAATALLKSVTRTEVASMDWATPRARQRIMSSVLVERELELDSTCVTPAQVDCVTPAQVDCVSFKDHTLTLLTPESCTQNPLVYLAPQNSLLTTPQATVTWKSEQASADDRITIDVHNIPSVL